MSCQNCLDFPNPHYLLHFPNEPVPQAFAEPFVKNNYNEKFSIKFEVIRKIEFFIHIYLKAKVKHSSSYINFVSHSIHSCTKVCLTKKAKNRLNKVRRTKE